MILFKEFKRHDFRMHVNASGKVMNIYLFSKAPCCQKVISVASIKIRLDQRGNLVFDKLHTIGHIVALVVHVDFLINRVVVQV